MRSALSLLTTLTVGIGLVVGPPATADPSPPPPSPANATGSALLITGDQLTVGTSPDGRRTVSVAPAAETGLARELVHLNVGGRSYQVPAAALPYLGRGLDLSLFDVDALLAAGKDGRIPVRIGSKGNGEGGGQPALPGVTVTGAGQGHLTAKGAEEFGAALVKQFLADRGRAPGSGSARATGLFAGGATLGLAGAATPKPRRSASAMRTLTLKANGPDGRPDYGDLAVVYNVDDGALFNDLEHTAAFVDGTATFTVPEGNYLALALFLSVDADGNVTGVRIVTQPETRVFSDATVRLDAHRATSKVTWVTPRQALPQESGFLLRRAATTGPALTVGVDNGPGVPVWVSSTSRPVAVGALQSYPYGRLSSPPAPGTPYEYFLQRATTGVIPQQRYVVKESDLATVDAAYYSELNSIGLRQRGAIYDFEDMQSRPSHSITLPRRQTEYVSADPAISWYGGLAKYYETSVGGFRAWYGGQSDATHTYRPGERLNEDWNRFPLHSVGNVSLVDPTSDLAYTVPPVTRSADRLRIAFTPFSDNQPGHTGTGFYGNQRDTITGAYRIEQNGVTIAEGDPSVGRDEFRADLKVTGDPSTLRLVLDAGRTGPMHLLSTQTHTEWTWRSGHEQGGKLPNAFVCEAARGEEPDRACSVEPLMTLRYAVGGLRVDGSAPSGEQTLDLDVGHLQLATASEVTGASVRFSTDDGKTWQDAAVTSQGNGGFLAAYTVTTGSLSGSYVSLQVTATDAAGGQITETLQRAYRVSQ